MCLDLSCLVNPIFSKIRRIIKRASNENVYEEALILFTWLSSHAESFIDIYRQVQYTVRYKTTKYKDDTLNTKVKKLRHQLQLFVESTRLC
jgi:hypothetical protein